MTDLHAAMAWAVGTAVVALLVVAVGTAVGLLRSYRALDAALLAHLAVTALTALAGIGAYLTGRPPADPLHLLYGAVALVAPGIARAAGQGRPSRTLARWVAGGALVALGATVRSFMTGN